MPQKGFSKLWILVIIAAVAVSGVLIYQQLQKPSEQPPIIQEQPAEDETEDWKTYRNEEYGYEIKYPENWDFEEYPAISTVGFGNPPPPEGSGEASPPVSVSIFSDSLQETIKKFSDKDHLNLRDITQDSVIIDNLKAVKIEGYIVREGLIKVDDGFKAAGVFFQNNSVTYEISFVEQYKGDVINLNIFNQMLSTFRFLE